jgi:hypothetical protein
VESEEEGKEMKRKQSREQNKKRGKKWKYVKRRRWVLSMIRCKLKLCSEVEHSVVELIATRVGLLDWLLRRRRYVRGILDTEVLFDKCSHIGVVKVCFGIWTRKSPQHTRHSVIAVARGVVEVIGSPASKLLSVVDWER